jgi:hypothetical protein
MKRTTQQNKSLHVGFKLIADALNDAGHDMRKVLKPTVEIPWSDKTVKEYLWRPIQKAMLQKSSTTELEKQMEIDRVWDVVMRHLNTPKENGEPLLDEYIPFPHDDEKISNYPDGKQII